MSSSNEPKESKPRPAVKPRPKTKNRATEDNKQILEEEVISAEFEKQVGKIQDFRLYFGTTGLFIRNIQPHSPLARLLKLQDQLIKVNDLDVKNLQHDAVDGILEKLSGTIRLKVVRIKGHEEKAEQSADSAGQEASFDDTASAMADVTYLKTKFENLIVESTPRKDLRRHSISKNKTNQGFVSTLKKNTKKTDEKEINKDQGPEKFDEQPNKRREQPNAEDENVLIPKSDETLTTEVQRSHDGKTEIQRLQDVNTDQIQHAKIVEENSSMYEINKLLQLENIQLSTLRNEEICKNNANIIIIQQFRQENDNKKVTIQRLQQELEQKNKICNETQQLRQENDNNKVTIQRLQQELEQKNKICNETQQLRQENDNGKDTIQRLQQELEQKNKICSETQQLRQENDNKKVTIQRLQQVLKRKNKICNEMQQLRQENDNKKVTIQQLQRENEDMGGELQDLQESIRCGFFTEKGSVQVSQQELGKGAYGAVYKGNYYGTEVAVKEFNEIIFSQYYEGILEREINIASQCRHPNLLQFICATKNVSNHLLIVTELMDMALRTLMEKHANKRSLLNDEQVQLISLDVARGLSYLHSKKPNPIIHRDVSSANVLLSIDENGVVRRAKISDYGSANFLKACNTANPGAAIYAAPEARQGQQDPKIDVFSYGCLVCEISICELPAPEASQRRRQITKIMNAETRKIVEECTEIEPQKRPTMLDVIVRWENL